MCERVSECVRGITIGLLLLISHTAGVVDLVVLEARLFLKKKKKKKLRKTKCFRHESFKLSPHHTSRGGREQVRSTSTCGVKAWAQVMEVSESFLQYSEPSESFLQSSEARLPSWPINRTVHHFDARVASG